MPRVSTSLAAGGRGGGAGGEGGVRVRAAAARGAAGGSRTLHLLRHCAMLPSIHTYSAITHPGSRSRPLSGSSLRSGAPPAFAAPAFAAPRFFGTGRAPPAAGVELPHPIPAPPGDGVTLGKPWEKKTFLFAPCPGLPKQQKKEETTS